MVFATFVVVTAPPALPPLGLSIVADEKGTQRIFRRTFLVLLDYLVDKQPQIRIKLMKIVLMDFQQAIPEEIWSNQI